LRNGIALSRTLHWAFDQGLFGFDPNSRRVYVPAQVRRMHDSVVPQLDGRVMGDVRNPALRASQEALAWHIENCVRQWD
jgi:putative restriction endonuclease